MSNKPKIFDIACFSLILMLLVLMGGETAWSIPLEIKADHGLISIQAERVLLSDVLQAVASEAGLTIKSNDELADTVSLSIRNMPVEAAVRRLLANRNYVIQFKEAQDGHLIPISLHVFGQGSETVIQAEISPQPTHDHMKRVEKDWFKKIFADTDRRLKEISVKKDDTTPEALGLRITKIAEDSPFNMIGFKENDLIVDVNSQPVNTVEDLIKALKSAPGIQKDIRIERFNDDHQEGPIYIELH